MVGKMSGVVKEVRESGGAVVVVVAGEITLDRSPAFHKELIAVCNRAPSRLVLEMSKVTHIDSAGVGTLVEIFRRVKQAQGKMFLVGLTTRVRSVFEITRLDQFFAIRETEQEALES